MSEGAAPKISLSLERSLLVSIELYQVVLSQMEKIATALAATAPLTALVQQLHGQQLAAQQHDEGLLALLHQAEHSVAHHLLYVQRADLIGQVLQLNRLLLPNIDGMMAVLAHELDQVRNGRVVLGGYKQGAQKQGRIIKSSV